MTAEWRVYGESLSYKMDIYEPCSSAHLPVSAGAIGTFDGSYHTQHWHVRGLKDTITGVGNKRRDAVRGRTDLPLLVITISVPSL